jgi:hypothetical protein
MIRDRHGYPLMTKTGRKYPKKKPFRKIHILGLSPSAVNWSRSFHSRAHSALSNWAPIWCGVTLGPQLAFCFLPTIITCSKYHLCDILYHVTELDATYKRVHRGDISLDFGYNDQSKLQLFNLPVIHTYVISTYLH